MSAFIKPVLFATFPRSGHHLLISMLQDYFGDEMKYCEFYNCCGRYPCSRGANAMKNHDFNLDLDAAPDHLVVMQFRLDDYKAIASWAEVSVGFDHSLKAMLEFYQNKKTFYDAFKVKWIARATFVLLYHQLVHQPSWALRGVIEHITNSSCDVDKVDAIVKKHDVSIRKRTMVLNV